MASTETKTFKNFIAGEWVDAASGETFETTVPATGETLGTFPKSGPEDVDRAVDAAKAAYEEWRLVPAPKRGEILFRFGQLLADQKDDLALLMAREMGKVLPEAAGDVQEAIDMSFYMGGEGRRLFGQTTPSELRDKFNMSVRQPIGVVGVITPWNFPIAIPSWKIAPALVCGNTVVFKPATDTPLLGERFVELLVEAGVPAGVVNIVHGGGGAVGDRLVRHPDVPVITLTGSRETGVEVMRNAADNLKHVHLELGGKNAIIVMDDADVDLAVDGILWSAFGTSGWRTSRSPTAPPPPWTMLTTPAGTPASTSSSTKRSPSSGVSVAGLKTTVFPQTSAGAIFQLGIAIGKFHGVITPTMPIGWRTLMLNLSLSSLGVVWPNRRRPSPPMYTDMSIASWTSPPASAFTFPISRVIRSARSSLLSARSCATSST